MTNVKKVKKPLMARIEGAFVDMSTGPVRAVCRSMSTLEIEGILALYSRTKSQIHKGSDLEIVNQILLILARKSSTAMIVELY